MPDNRGVEAYRPPKNAQEAKERLASIRRMIVERAKEVGPEVACQDKLAMPIVWDIMKSYDVLIEDMAE